VIILEKNYTEKDESKMKSQKIYILGLGNI